MYVDKWVAATFKQKIWKINTFTFVGFLRKTIFGLEPAGLVLKCDVLELKD